MKQIIFKDKFLDKIISGEKKQTIRNWKKINLNIGEIVEATNYNKKIKIKIKEIYIKKILNITEKEAILDGFDSLNSLQNEILKIYKTLNFDAYVIKFDVLN